MALLCTNTPEGKRHKLVKYLVHDLRQFDKDVQDLFELSADCLSDDMELCIESGSSALFQHKSSVTKVGRQTYRMWKATLELSAGLIFKSDLLDKPKILHFCPLENFPEVVTSTFRVPGFDLVQFLVHFLQTYFPGLDIRLEAPRDINKDLNLVSRYHTKTKKKQFLVTDLYTKLHTLTGTPRKEFILGFTWTDLYPKDELNFVLGEASFQHRCAVLSFGRYEPLSFKKDDPLDANDEINDTEEDDNDEETSVVVDGDLLWKLLRVATHETSHLFGLNHCVFFECSMNESKSVSEALAQPLMLCPICLRKLQRFLNFDVKERYQGLLDSCQILQDAYPSPGMENTVKWLHRCIIFLNKGV